MFPGKPSVIFQNCFLNCKIIVYIMKARNPDVGTPGFHFPLRECDILFAIQLYRISHKSTRAYFLYHSLNVAPVQLCRCS